MKLVLHMIANAHLDPVWLWRRSSAVDEIIATCRTACSLLEEYPEFVVTRGEAWCYEQLRKHDPALFRRVVRHVESGRWQPVNGWWVQPDCIFPTPDSFRRQAEIGGKWFRANLGVQVTVGYNVDSFGHCAMIPSFLREAGMDSYVFMRPGPHEKELPAELFTWEAPGEQRVTACRIFGSYNDNGADRLRRKVEAMIGQSSSLPGHAMCFFGIGNHGGGPSRAEIEWVIGNPRPAPGVELRFSHPRACFDAVAAGEKPVVRGDLLHHAVGCYSAMHEFKQEMRRAENLLSQAEVLAETAGQEMTAKLVPAWRRILFNQAHDLLGGTAVQSAYAQARDELGAAASTARDVIEGLLQRSMRSLPARPRQRLVITNASRRLFNGLMEIEPWLGYADWQRPFWISDEGGAPVPFQRIAPEAAVPGGLRILLQVRAPAGGKSVLEVHLGEEIPPACAVETGEGTIANGLVSVALDHRGIRELRKGKASIARGVTLAGFQDSSDAWSHDLGGFEGAQVGVFEARDAWTVLERGPLRAVFANELSLGKASVSWRVSLQAGEAVARMLMRLRGVGGQQVVKLLVPFCGGVKNRIDGCPGGTVPRPLDGLEYPIQDIQAREGDGVSIALVSPDCYAADVQPDGTLRATLLRTPYFAHQDPFHVPPGHPYPSTSQGEHDYSIALVVMNELDLELLADEAERQNRQPFFSECTTGMPPR